MLKDLKMQSKLMYVFGGIILVGTLIAAWTVLSINRLDSTAQGLYAAEQEISQALQARNGLKEMEALELSYVLSEDITFMHHHAITFSALELYLRNAFIRTEEPQVQAVLFEIEEELHAYTETISQVEEAGQAGDWEEAIKLGERSVEEIEGMVARLDVLVERYTQDIETLVARSNRQVTLSSIVGGATLLVFLVLSITTSSLVHRQVNLPILQIMQSAKKISVGDYDIKSLAHITQRPDELGQLSRAFEEMALEMQQRETNLREKIATTREELGE